MSYQFDSNYNQKNCSACNSWNKGDGKDNVAWTVCINPSSGKFVPQPYYAGGGGVNDYNIFTKDANQSCSNSDDPVACNAEVTQYQGYFNNAQSCSVASPYNGYDTDTNDCNACYQSSVQQQENYCSPCSNGNFDYEPLNKAYSIQKKYSL